MTKIYAAADGNYGDAEDLVILDLDELGFPIGDFFDNVSDDERAPLAIALGENARLIRIARNLLGTDQPQGDDPETDFPEYFRGQVELVRDMLGAGLAEYETVAALLALSPEA
jgi:hypothetical protein